MGAAAPLRALQVHVDPAPAGDRRCRFAIEIHQHAGSLHLQGGLAELVSPPRGASDVHLRPGLAVTGVGRTAARAASGTDRWIRPGPASYV